MAHSNLLSENLTDPLVKNQTALDNLIIEKNSLRKKLNSAEYNLVFKSVLPISNENNQDNRSSLKKLKNKSKKYIDIQKRLVALHSLSSSSINNQE